MILPTAKYSFKLLTACFCGGADNQAAAEMRVPSIRGQVRAWQRAIGRQNVGATWGSTEGDAGASRVALLVDRPFTTASSVPRKLLPHCDEKSPNFQERRKATSQRPALAPRENFTVTLQRLVGCSAGDWTGAQNALKLWLLVGCLGLRANRAAGSVWPVGDWVPQTAAQLAETLQRLGFSWPMQLVETPVGTKADELRRLASDTVKNRQLFGEIKPRREPSPTKFKVIELAGQPRLLVTAPPSINLAAVRDALSGPKKAGQFQWSPLSVHTHHP